ncbi:MAG TPA: heparinase II/III family protein, partial [Pyrinomonadaceae bacterium]|nr:heparinase II/III family protein [Pyrinomonadaceae bacterium]
MVDKLKIWKSLKGRSLEELRVRGAQKIAAVGERVGFSSQARTPSDEAFFKLLDRESPGSIRSAEDLLKHFRTRNRPHFFAAFDNREETVEELRRRFGKEAEELTVARAEKIMRGRFDLLGFHDLSFGDPVDWHLEPVAEKRTPLSHWSRINYLAASEAGDKKIIWELNRHQYFMTLGRAYWYTLDERYAERFAAHLSDWMDRNPPKAGINWASSLEVAFRSIAWLWSLYFFL